MEILCPDHGGIISTKHDASHIIKAISLCNARRYSYLVVYNKINIIGYSCSELGDIDS